jgi:hypothetical protein
MLKNPNEAVHKYGDQVRMITDLRVKDILRNLYLGEGTIRSLAGATGNTQGDVAALLEPLAKSGLVHATGERLSLSDRARRRLDLQFTTYEELQGTILHSRSAAIKYPLAGAYRLIESIGCGSTSRTFLGEQLAVHRHRAVKLFLPHVAAFSKVDEALKKHNLINQAIKDPALPDVIDAGEVLVNTADGNRVVVPCVVFEYVDSGAMSFSRFLSEPRAPTPGLFEHFVAEVGGALETLEAAGLEHGDLHEGNILVALGESKDTARCFWVIDYIGVPSLSSPDLEQRSDLTNFKDHLLRAVERACHFSPGQPIRLLLGDRVSRVLEGLIAGAYSSFAALMRDFARAPEPLPDAYFLAVKDPFEWLRVEWFGSGEWLFKLFEPDRSRYEAIARFGNTWISGPRGCGKSHYIRVLSFQPAVIAKARHDKKLAAKLADLNYDFRQVFGVLFPCRVGEFREYTPDAMALSEFDTATNAVLRHIFILKIMRRTLQSMLEGLGSRPDRADAVLALPTDASPILSFFERRMGRAAMIEHRSTYDAVVDCVSVCVSREQAAASTWDRPDARPAELLDERDLGSFFAAIRAVFPDLQRTRFYILVDDAGELHPAAQKVLNCLLRSAQSGYCFKLTSEKYAYTFDTADGPPLNPFHDGTYVDLGELSSKPQQAAAIDQTAYMSRIVNTRLREANYRQHSIEKLLGPSQDVTSFLAALSAGRKRPHGHEPGQRALYAGWHVIRSLCHGSIRTLLALLEYLFRSAEVTKEVSFIPPEKQDFAVRAFSNQYFRSLAMLPGEYEGAPLGEKLRAVLSSIGAVSRAYLQHYDTGEPGRWHETISIERLDQKPLRQTAQTILENLVKNEFLVDQGVTLSRAQFGLCSRYDLNKILAPAFRTTYRVRNHMYLSSRWFEELLLSPDEFVRRQSEKLTRMAEPQRQVGLFDDA